VARLGITGEKCERQKSKSNQVRIILHETIRRTNGWTVSGASYSAQEGLPNCTPTLA
jgi:hypothetical protein